MLVGHLALTAAALFTGAAFYINAVEQPARMQLADGPLLSQWKPAYRRGYAMQASLAVIGFLLGVAAWWTAREPGFLVGAFLMLANWPWTLLAIKPVNAVLMATEPAHADGETRRLLARWNRLHGMRTALGALAVMSFLWALRGG
jgi:hypothetical protein